MSELTASRMCWTESESGTPFQFERKNGYMVCLHRRPLPSSPCWIDGRAITRKPMNRGQFLLLDRNRNHEALTYGGAVDCISIYTSREAIDRFLEEHEVRSSGLLRTPEGLAFDDNVIESLGEALVPALEQPNAASQLFVDYIALALLARLAEFYGEDPAVARQIRGGLAHWQERRAKEALMAHIDGKIGLVDLARETGLSRSHFARAFRQTTGMPPHKWLQVRRIELAQDLLRNSTLPVEKIAVRCGFIDQSHMTRTFTKAVGMPPGEWRRSFR
jgi:AraC family transcriptional regulator